MQTPFSFARKISLHSVALILISCISVTAVTTFQFRRELYRQAFGSAFMVYMAAVNYITGHYRSHDDTFYQSSLRYVFENRFMKLDGADAGVDRYRPERIAIYDPQGARVFEYSKQGEPGDRESIAPGDLPTAYMHDYDKAAGVIRGAGPVVSEGETIAYVEITCLTDLETKVIALYLKCFAAMAAVLVIAIVLSFLFARRALAPIEALTEAAQRVRAGDLNQRVPVDSNDEIGMLASTFNGMISSLTRRMALMHRMQEWTFRLGKEFDLKKLYEAVMEMFERMGQTSACRLYIHDHKTDSLQLIAYRGGDATISLRGDQLTRMAYEKNDSLYMREDKTFVTDANGAIEMALPLFTGNKSIGAVRLGPREDGQTYDEETVTTLRTLTQLAAVAIDNTRLYKELAEQERIAQEMKLARDIQQSLLPRAVPDIPGYDAFGISIPALEVGGDYFDFVTKDGSQWHFVVGDVSGKGVPAALIMSIVRSLIHTIAEITPDPRDILIKVNRNLSPDLESEMFVTVADVSVNLETHVARVVRAGHEPILIIRENGQIERIEPRGSALGLLDVATFEKSLEETEIKIGRRDVVLLYTDGLTETRNRDGAEIGYDGLEALARKYAHLPARDMVGAIAEEIKSFAGGQDPHDDFTMVVFRRLA